MGQKSVLARQSLKLRLRGLSLVDHKQRGEKSRDIRGHFNSRRFFRLNCASERRTTKTLRDRGCLFANVNAAKQLNRVLATLASKSFHKEPSYQHVLRHTNERHTQLLRFVSLNNTPPMHRSSWFLSPLWCLHNEATSTPSDVSRVLGLALVRRTANDTKTQSSRSRTGFSNHAFTESSHLDTCKTL